MELEDLKKLISPNIKTISPAYCDSRMVIYKTYALCLLLYYKKLGLIDKFSINYSDYIDCNDKCATCKENQDCEAFYNANFSVLTDVGYYVESILPCLGWDIFVEDKAYEKLSELYAGVSIYRSDLDSNEIYPYCTFNKKWKIFLDNANIHPEVKADSLYLLFEDNIPIDFFLFGFYGDYVTLPFNGAFYHLIGYNEGLSLYLEALDVSFPAKVMICDYYMDKLVFKYPFLLDGFKEGVK